MTGSNEFNDILRFHCPSCRAELSVPATLAGIEGPCPSCSATIQAPLPEALYEPAPVIFRHLAAAASSAKMVFPEGREPGIPPIPKPVRAAADGMGIPQSPEKNFQARMGIPRQDESLDDSWKDRHRDIRRQTRRVRRVEKAAQSFLDSRGFQFARVALILLSGAMLAWLFQYLRTHQWQFPGMSPTMADEAGGQAPGSPGGTAATAGNESPADDDTEIPPAADGLPGTRASDPQSSGPIAGKPPLP